MSLWEEARVLKESTGRHRKALAWNRTQTLGPYFCEVTVLATAPLIFGRYLCFINLQITMQAAVSHLYH